MRFYIVQWLILIRLYCGNAYTWSYNDWLKHVYKQWGTGTSGFIVHRPPVQEKFNCKTTTFKDVNGSFTSPNYPKHYPNNAECTWVIEAPSEFNEIHLDLIKFNVENPKWSKLCFKDYVEIYQYINGKRQKKGTYCGKRSKTDLTIYSNKAEIVFKSNGYRTKKGFNIKWSGRKGCGGIVSGINGAIALPISNTVDHRFYCQWKIKAPSTHNQIQINIRDLVYPRNYTSCKKGSLTILNKYGETLGEYCEKQRSTSIRVLDNEAIIRMRIAKKTKMYNFQATWKSSIYKVEALKCGIPSIEHARYRRLVGGNVVQQGASPWIVQVRTLIIGRNYRTRTVYCGGVIISPSFILTAAHCVERKSKVISYEVLMGTTSEYITEQNIVLLNKEHVYSHPDFLWNRNGKPKNDIALLRLPKPVTFNHKIQPICLPDKQRNASNDCSFSGWGKTSQHSRHSPQLNSIKAYEHGHCDNSPSVLCVSYHGSNTGACKGDSGSPITCRDANKRHYVSGVLSYGARTCPSSVDGYADVSYYLDWIHNTMSKYRNDKTNS